MKYRTALISTEMICLVMCTAFVTSYKPSLFVTAVLFAVVCTVALAFVKQFYRTNLKLIVLRSLSYKMQRMEARQLIKEVTYIQEETLAEYEHLLTQVKSGKVEKDADRVEQNLYKLSRKITSTKEDIAKLIELEQRLSTLIDEISANVQKGNY